MNGVRDAKTGSASTENLATDLIDRLRASDPHVLDLVRLICGDTDPGGEFTRDLPPRVVRERLIELLRQQLLRPQSEATLSAERRPSTGLTSWQVKRVSAYMCDNLDKDIGLQELADLVKLSRFYFCTAFRQATGYTPLERLTQLRIEESRRLLAMPSMAITEVAMAVGYQTSSSFAAAFRRVVGVSPSEYRRSL